MKGDRWRSGLASLAVGLMLAGCAGGGTTTGPATAVAVTDLASVAGKWTGLLELEGARDREDLVELTVDRGGTYRASAARTIGLMDAQGKVALSDGKVLLEGARGAKATGTLYAQPGSPERSLLMQGATPAGRRFSVRLRPAGS